MAEIYEGPDAVRAYLSGATADGLGQYDHGASLGGFRSGARVSCMTTQRITAFPGLRLRYVDAANGIGLGRLFAVGPNTLKWAAPGEAYGDAVTITNGQEKVLRSATASKFIVVGRVSVLALSGVENVQISDTYGNVVGMGDFTEAQSTAGHEKYRALILKNVGAVSATSVQVFRLADTSDRVEVASEALVADEIQTIADEDTAPTGLTFVDATSGSPLAIGTLAAGDAIGLWIKSFVDTGETYDPRVINALVVRFTIGADTFDVHLRGATHCAEDGIEGILFWWGQDAEPDWQNDPADEFSDTFPVTLTENIGATEARWYLAERKRNKYGIVGPPVRPMKMFDVAGDGTLNNLRPSGPSVVQVRPWAAGGYRIDAQYIPEWDTIGYRATHWLFYVTLDGVDPDPDTDTPVVVAMGYDSLGAIVGAVPVLREVVTTELEDTPVKVLVRTRRAAAGLIEAQDSTNTTIYETTLEYCGPARPAGFVKYNQGMGIYTAPAEGPDGTPVVIDVANDIYLEMIAGQTRLWYDDGTPHLIFNVKFDSSGEPGGNGFYTPLQHDGVDIDTTGSADEMDVISWTGGDKRLGMNVNGQRVMQFDITNNRIQNRAVFGGDEPSGACQPVPLWGKYAHTVIMVFDPTAQRYVAVASLDSTGALVCKVGFFPLTPEADCL